MLLQPASIIENNLHSEKYIYWNLRVSVDVEREGHENWRVKIVIFQEYNFVSIRSKLNCSWAFVRKFLPFTAGEGDENRISRAVLVVMMKLFLLCNTKDPLFLSFNELLVFHITRNFSYVKFLNSSGERFPFSSLFSRFPDFNSINFSFPYPENFPFGAPTSIHFKSNFHLVDVDR